MKKSIFKIGLFSLLIVTMMLIISCEKIEDPDPIVVVPTTYTVEAYVKGFGLGGGRISPAGSFFQVDSGSSMKFTLTPNPGFKTDSILVNNKLESLTDNTFSLENIADNYRLDAIFEMTEEMRLLTQKPWTLVRWQNKFNLLTETKWDIDLLAKDSAVTGMAINTYIFDAKSSTFTKWRKGELIGNGNYELKLNVDSLIIGGGLKFKILELSEDSLVIESRVPYVDLSVNPPVWDPTKDGIGRETYEHK